MAGAQERGGRIRGFGDTRNAKESQESQYFVFSWGKKSKLEVSETSLGRLMRQVGYLHVDLLTY